MKVWINEGYKIATNAFGNSAYSTIKIIFRQVSLYHEMDVDVTGFLLCLLEEINTGVRLLFDRQPKELQRIHYENYKILWKAGGGDGGHSRLLCRLRYRSAAG